MRVGDGVGVVATAPKLACVIHQPRASGVARVDGKPTLISEVVKSLRSGRTDSSRHNHCHVNNQTSAMKPEMRGSCQKGNRSVRLMACRGRCTP